MRVSSRRAVCTALVFDKHDNVYRKYKVQRILYCSIRYGARRCVIHADFSSVQTERNQVRSVDRLIGCADQYDAMIVSVVTSYDTYLGGPFVCLTAPS